MVNFNTNLKRFCVLFVAFFALFVAIFGMTGVASAHTAAPTHVAATCATDQAALVNAVNADRADDSISPDGVVTDGDDLAVATAQAQLIADGCTSSVNVGGFGGSGGFHGFTPGFRFRQLSAQQSAAQCAAFLAFVSSMHLGPQHSASASAYLAEFCQGSTGGVTSPVTSPFTPASYGSYRCFSYYCY